MYHNVVIKKRIKVRSGPNGQILPTLISNIKRSNHTHPNGTVIFGFSMKLSLKWYTGLSYLHNVSQFCNKKRIKVRPGANGQILRTSISNIKRSNHTHPNGTVIFGFSMKLSFRKDPTTLCLDNFSIFTSGVPGGPGRVPSGPPWGV